MHKRKMIITMLAAMLVFLLAGSACCSETDTFSGLWVYNELTMDGPTLANVLELSEDHSCSFYFLLDHEEIGSRTEGKWSVQGNRITIEADRLALHDLDIREENDTVYLYGNGLDRYVQYDTEADIPDIVEASSDIRDLSGLWEHNSHIDPEQEYLDLKDDGNFVRQVFKDGIETKDRWTGTYETQGHRLILSYDWPDAQQEYIVRTNGAEFLLYNENGEEFHFVYGKGPWNGDSETGHQESASTETESFPRPDLVSPDFFEPMTQSTEDNIGNVCHFRFRENTSSFVSDGFLDYARELILKGFDIESNDSFGDTSFSLRDTDGNIIGLVMIVKEDTGNGRELIVMTDEDLVSILQYLDKSPSSDTAANTGHAEDSTSTSDSHDDSTSSYDYSAYGGEALERAHSYLNYTAFSHDGLVEQLEFEGFGHAEAKAAADACGADWYEQAVKKAESYLESSAFSYKGLIEQLEFEGFTGDQAAYGADHCGANWNEQAAKKAASYLEFSYFSRSDLIDQLEFEGFTYEQAVYGVGQNGL